MDISVLAWLLPTVIGGIILYGLSNYATFWRFKNTLSEILIALFLVAGVFLATISLWPLYSLLMLGAVQLWLILLALRLRFGRLHSQFLQHSIRLSIVIASALLLIGFMLTALPLFMMQWSIAIAGLLGSVVFLYQTIWTLRHYALRVGSRLPLKDLPTVTLAIPARNETHALTDCLTQAIASDYPKLEILVLDDCSQDTTSSLIRSFAHDGVRFVQGNQPADGWLGKNQAFQTLLAQATGEYIIFAGVDTHFEPQSISHLVNYCLQKNMTMISVLPQRRDIANLATFLWQLRYFWQVALPITKRRVPVASQAWLIKADVLQKMGGFNAVHNKITPEGNFARRLFTKNSYRFVVSDYQLGITTAKRLNSQSQSAIRFLYPTFKRQPFFILLACFGIGLLLALPCIAITATAPLAILCIGAMLLLTLSYLLVIARAIPYMWPVTLIFFPLSLIQEIALLITSMLLYEFGEVNWKGRNVCYPVIALDRHKQ